MISILDKLRNRASGVEQTGQSSPKETDNVPFFIVGSPRSGTTLLRDLFRLHPRLECPEETHFFRWADPFHSYRFKSAYKNENIFNQHRQLDGIPDQEFFAAFESVADKKALADWYGTQYLKSQDNLSGRWFDKTPQNVYGVLLIRAFYPTARYIHIVRNPLNVVASLVEGKVMPAQTLRAAISTWLESVLILDQFAKIAGADLLEVSYENLVADVIPCLTNCLRFVGEDPGKVDFSQIETHAEKNKYVEVLTAEQIDEVISATEPFFSNYGYKLD